MDISGMCESSVNHLSCKRRFVSDPENLDLTSPYVPLKDKSLSNDPFSISGHTQTSIVTADDLIDNVDLSLVYPADNQAEDLMRKETESLKLQNKFCCQVYEEPWKLCHFNSLPDWLKDNDFLHKGYRPPLPSFYACFQSIFRIHTETGNIWTHLLGCIFFIFITLYFLNHPAYQWEEKIVFAAFFAGAIACLGMSFIYHTVQCHSKRVGKVFNKLDYCGIAFLITGSFVPWLYYGFYCRFQPKLVYLAVVIVLGAASIAVSLPDKFSEPRFRFFRAGVFMAFGLSGVVPAFHYVIAEGWIRAVYQASFGWLCLMGTLYIIGGLFYALRIPERFYPGKFDIWFHSHQIFHVLVIVAACGITRMAMQSKIKCDPDS